MTFYTRNDVTFRGHHILQVIYCSFNYFDSAFSSPLSRSHPIKTKENEIQRCNWTVSTQNGIEYRIKDIIDGDSVYTGVNDDLCWNSKEIFSWWFCLNQCLWKTLYSCWFTEVIEILKVIDELTACPFGSLKRNCCYPGAIKVHQLRWSWSAIVGFTEKKIAERCERPEDCLQILPVWNGPECETVGTETLRRSSERKHETFKLHKVSLVCLVFSWHWMLLVLHQLRLPVVHRFRISWWAVITQQENKTRHVTWQVTES